MTEGQLGNETVRRIFKGDRWTRAYGSRIPDGATVEVLKFCPRRRVLVRYEGEPILTMLWCLKKIAPLCGDRSGPCPVTVEEMP